MKYKIIKLNSARNCLRYLVRAVGIKEIYVPYYLCFAVRDALYKENCKIKFYHIDLNFRPVISFPEFAYIIYPNYWGICGDIVNELSLRYRNLIIDNSHSFYSEPKGIASINSLRKFFPQLRDGAFLYTLINLNQEFPVDDYSYKFEKLYDYELICRNEKRIDEAGIKKISKTTEEYYEKLDLAEEKKLRIKKFNKIREKYDSENLININIKENDAPFCYPFLAESKEKAAEIVEEYKSKSIFIYKYWNNLPASYFENIFYNRLVCIPIDF